MYKRCHSLLLKVQDRSFMVQYNFDAALLVSMYLCFMIRIQKNVMFILSMGCCSVWSYSDSRDNGRAMLN